MCSEVKIAYLFSLSLISGTFKYFLGIGKVGFAIKRVILKKFLPFYSVCKLSFPKMVFLKTIFALNLVVRAILD